MLDRFGHVAFCLIELADTAQDRGIALPIEHLAMQVLGFLKALQAFLAASEQDVVRRQPFKQRSGLLASTLSPRSSSRLCTTGRIVQRNVVLGHAPLCSLHS